MKPSPLKAAPKSKNLKVDTELLLDAAQRVFSKSGMDGASIRATRLQNLHRSTFRRCAEFHSALRVGAHSD